MYYYLPLKASLVGVLPLCKIETAAVPPCVWRVVPVKTPYSSKLALLFCGCHPQSPSCPCSTARASRYVAAVPIVIFLALTSRLPSQSPDTKKEEFRRYLERSGVIDALTKGGLALYSRRPCVELADNVHDYSPPPPPHVRASSLPLAVLVGLYEEPEKPANALE